ncbi:MULTISPECIES: hypothetical protein [unclassified Endozoicomonas]|uniref:hypothetical protein n=1 Tax=unclassified Endozoicomonas TaxID=2644528 RepID=UPI002148A67B|nr:MULTISPECIES: hypothetical protein [unclassified Endozoicomonas]
MLLWLLSVVCEAESYTECYIVELEQNAVFPNQSFSIKPGPYTLPGNPSVIVGTESYAGSDSPPDDKPYRPGVYGFKAILIESISWQLLHATHLLVNYEPIMTTKSPSLNATPYSWIPLEVVVTVDWLLRSYWNPDSPLFKMMEQQEATSTLTQGNHPFAPITMMFGSGDNQQTYQQQEQSSKSSGQLARDHTSYLSGFWYSRFGDGNEGYQQQHQHTLGFNCFVFPCNGVCQLRLSSNDRVPAEWLQNASGSSCCHLTHGHYPLYISHADPEEARPQHSHFETLNPLPAYQPQSVSEQLIKLMAHGYGNPAISSNAIDRVAPDWVVPDSTSAGAAYITEVTRLINDDVPGPGNNCLPPGGATPGVPTHCQKTLSDQKRKYHTGQKTCDVIVVGEDGQLRPCGKVSMHARALSEHKSKIHTGQKVCDVMVVGKDGQPRPCGWLCKNAGILSAHKSGYHTGQKTCDVTVIGKDGELRPCGVVCKNAGSLWVHKSGFHTNQKTCDFSVVGEDGQQQPCGKICKNAQSLMVHKSEYHSGQKTCCLTLVGKDGQQRLCGKVCKHAKALSEHKRSVHSSQVNCNVIVVGKDGQQRPCGKVCNNARTLSNHKSRIHGKEKICDVTIGEDGQQQPCGRIYKNSDSLSKHKRIHRKRKPVVVDQNDDFNP